MSAALVVAQPGRWLPGAALLRTVEFNAIPGMTDPLGRHWDQPDDIRCAAMDATHVRLTARQVHGLMVYDSSYPSGTYDGKCWLRNGPEGVQWLCWYHPHEQAGKIGIGSREVLAIDRGEL